MPAEVPVWIKSIEPRTITVPMSEYSQAGLLFPDRTQATRFVVDTWDLWRQSPEIGMNPPHILLFDFEGVTDFKPEQVRNAFAIVWANQRVVSHEMYALFDKVRPWQKFEGAVPAPRRWITARVIIARMAEEDYQLVGDWRKVLDYRNVFAALQEEDPWVDGTDFAKRRLDPPTPTVLSKMHKEGLLIQRREYHSGGRAYYRTLSG